MKRKLVKQGAATMMISLPSKWIRKNNLDKGDEINLEEKGNELLINTEEIQKTKKEITISINDENKHDIKVLLTHAYRRGFDRITFENIDNKDLLEIREVTEKLLLGFEIIEKGNKRCVLENISEPKESKYEVMIKKIFLITKEQQDIILSDFEKIKFDNLNEIEETRYQQDRFVIFCRRLLTKENIEDAILEWELLTFLMHINHSYYYLYKYASENKINSDKNIMELLKELMSYFSLFEDAYYNKNINAIHKINSLEYKHHFGKCLDLIKKSNNPVVHSYIREIFRLIQIGSSPLIGLILEKKI